ncbi:F-box domain-containing protein [Mycena kentingensis (nom. inval.)]|nr:F-box domain-containing protein [Mycena kentingensis (nom. inval.)]
MAATSIPDEILSEILSPALKVADDAFSDTSSAAFAAYEESTSAYLLVNRAWLRVATPLLYHTVVLRSKAQAVALADALAANNYLGRFVKRMRIEGGFGPSMKKIFAQTSNVTDLFLSLDIYSNDSVGGLCSGLNLLSPSRLILKRDTRTRNKMVTALENAVVAAVPGWDRLVRYISAPLAETHRCVTQTFVDSPFWSRADGEELMNALANANRLQHLVVPDADAAIWCYQFVKMCPLRIVESRHPQSSWNTLRAEYSSSALSALLKFQEPQKDPTTRPPHLAPAIAPSLNISYKPLEASSPEVRTLVWSRILYFAMSVPERWDGVHDLWASGRRSHTIQKFPGRLSLLLVCKLFLALGRSYFYSHISINAPRLEGFKAALSSGIVGASAPKFITSTYSILLKSFADIAERLGPSLAGLHVPVYAPNDAEMPAALFSNFTALRRLNWNGVVRVASSPPSSVMFPALEELVVRSIEKSLMNLFSELPLPRLRALAILGGPYGFYPDIPEHECGKMVEAHGQKLESLVLSTAVADGLGERLLATCSRLSSLTIMLQWSDEPPSVESLSPLKPATALKTLVIDDSSSGAGKAKDVAGRWAQFFDAWDPKTCIPNVKEIKCKLFAWPTTEREIAKNSWVRIAEGLFGGWD